MVTTLAETDHSTDNIILAALFTRVVHILQVEMLRYRRQCLQNARAFGL